MTTWTQVTSPAGMATGTTQNLAYGAGVWVIGDELEGKVWTSSDDGNTWSAPITISTLNAVFGLAFGGGLFVLIGPVSTGGYSIFTSPDGVTWTARANFADWILQSAQQGSQSMAYSGSLWVLVGGAIGAGGPTSITSPDGITWTPHSIYSAQNPNGFLGVDTDGTHFLGIVSDSGLTPPTQIATSTDGANWTFQATNTLPGPDGSANGVAHFDGKWIVGSGFDASGPGQGWFEIGTVLPPSWDGVQVNIGSGEVVAVNPGASSASLPLLIGIETNASTSQALALATTNAFATLVTEDMGYGATGSPFAIARGADAFMSAGADSLGNNLVTLRTDGVTVPNLIGLTQSAAAVALTTVGLVVGTVSEFFSAFPLGQVYDQAPVAGTTVSPGTAVDLTVSLGQEQVPVPNLIGDTAAAATAALVAVGLALGSVSGIAFPSIAIGDIATQSIAPGTIVAQGTAVNVGVSFIAPEFDVDATVISQYANSPTIVALVEDFGQWFDPSSNIQNFYLTVWNIDTATGFGLDIWGIILGVSRVIPIPGTSGVFGFENSDTPFDWENFGNINNAAAGGPFDGGQISTGSFKLSDGPYRTLLLTKALANICATTAPALNALITNLFPGRGRCYTQDLGGMQMSYVFEFALTNIEFSILAFSGVLAHPAGVGVNIVGLTEGLFGFREAGTSVKPFNFGTFYNG